MSKIEVDAKLTLNQEWLGVVVANLVLTVGAFLVGYLANELAGLYSDKDPVILTSTLEWVYKIWSKGLLLLVSLPVIGYGLKKWFDWSELFVSKLAGKIK